MNILVTGGAGFIGSHTLIALIEAGHTPIVIDNLANSSKEAITRVEKIAGKSIIFYGNDLCDAQALNAIFFDHHIDGVIHFAGFKAVGESIQQPLMYYQNNLETTIALLNAMSSHGIKKIVFSSSATVYGDQETMPIPENAILPSRTANPYGQTKLIIEYILRDLAAASASWQISILRYFNPVGAHRSGLIGEDPDGPPANLFPYISHVLSGKQTKLTVFGNDYDTPDGTGIRDYIHVMDLAQGHVAALEHMPDSGCSVYNLGTGIGHSVLEVIAAFEKASNKKVAHTIAARRSGDIARSIADPTKAKKELNWSALKTLDDMCQDSWNWQSRNPHGYTT